MHRLTSLLSLLLVLPALAQDIAEEAEIPEIRRYTVEVIIFRYAQDVGVGSELFLPDEPEPEERPTDEELVIIEEPAPEEEHGPLPDIELAILGRNDYQMLDILDKLERLDVYEPLMHFGWTQATWPQEQTEALPILLFGHPPDGLDGKLTLYLGRYLHLVVDLQLEVPGQKSEVAESTPAFGDYPSSGDLGTPLESQPIYYRIQEDRILRNGELRYYDHPKFGLLARVTRVEEEEEVDPEAGELLGYPLE